MIDTFFTVLKKSMVAMMFVVVGLAMTYVPQPHHDGGYSNVETAHAAGAAVGLLQLVQETYTAVQTLAIQIAEQWIYLKESFLDLLAWNFAKNMMADMTGDIVDWVNGSSDGKQRFILNLEDTLKEEADIAIGEFINSLDGLDFLCDPWRFDIKLAVAIQADANRDRRPVPECTLTDIIENLDDFLDGDFSSGGWPAWFEMTSNPSANTPAGARATVLQLANEAVAEAEETKRAEADWAQGLLAIKKCEEFPLDNGAIKENCFTTTNGSVVRETLVKALGTGQDQLAQADEFDEFATSLITGLATNIFSGEGLLGLSGGTGFTYSGYSRGSFIADLGNDPDNAIIDEDGSTVIEFEDGGPDDDSNLSSTDPAVIIDNAIEELNGFIDILDLYETALEEFVANPENATGTLLIVGELSLSQVNDLQDRVAEEIPLLEQQLADYLAIVEPSYADDSAAIQAFYSLGVLTEAELDLYTDQWIQVLGENIPGPNSDPDPDPDPIDPCDLDPFEEGCPCFNNPSCNIDRE